MTSEDQFDDIDEFDDGEEDNFASEQPKKKSPLFNIIMYGVLIGGVAYGYLEFDKIMSKFVPTEKPAAVTQTDTPKDNMDNSLAGLDMPPMPGVATEDVTLDDLSIEPDTSMGLMPEIADTADDFMLENIDEDMSGMGDFDLGKSEATPELGGGAVPEMGLEPIDGSSDIALAVDEEPNAITIDVNPDTMEAQALETVDTEVEELAVHADTSSMIDDLKQEVSNLTQAKEEAADKLEAANAEIIQLKAELKSLNRDLSANKSVQKMSEARKQPVKTAPVVKQPVKEVVINWKLKSAGPGYAMVANPRNGDLINLTIGDKLAGFGKIKEIKKDDSGRWFVLAEKGRIDQ